MVFHRPASAFFLFFLTILLFLWAMPVEASEKKNAAKTVLVLDASGSMWGRIGDKTKIEIARRVIADLVGNMDPNVYLGLTVYGHRRKGDCRDIENIIRPGPMNPATFISTVNRLKPKGKTPLSEAVRQAAETLRYTEEAATVILVSDGIETCAADPCAVAKSLEETGVSFMLHVVGFGLKPSETKALQCMAKVTGGQYFNADDAASLSKALVQAVKSAAVNTRVNIFVYPVLGPGGPPVDAGVYWSLKQLDARNDALPIEIKDRLDYKLVQALEPGTYKVSGRAAHTSGETEIVVEDAGPTKFDLPLIAGAINLFVFEEEGKPFARLDQLHKTLFALDNDGAPVKDKTIPLGGDYQNPIIVPPGRYRLSASSGQIKAARDINLALGQIVDVNLLLASGVLTVALVSAPGAPLKADGNVWVSVLALDNNGNPAKEGQQAPYNSSFGKEPAFRLLPGRYRISSKLGATTGREDITITAGEKKTLKLTMASGRVRLTAVDSNGNKRSCKYNLWWSIYPVGGDGKPTNKRVGLKSGISKVFVLPPGRYKARASCDVDRGEATGEAIFDVAVAQEINRTVKVVPKEK